MAPALVNCTGKPKFVQVGNRLVQLPEAPEPRLLTVTRDREQLTVRVGDDDVDMDVVTVKAAAVSVCPPVVDGILWLVSNDTLGEFPHRDDFVTPGVYQLVDAERVEVDGIDEASLNACRIDGMISVLCGLARNAAAADETTPLLADIEAQA